MKKVSLKKGRESTLARKHPWIFSGGLHNPDKTIEDGETVQLTNYLGEVLAVGHYSKASIAVRVLSYSDTIVDEEFYLTKILAAKEMRSHTLGLPSKETNCYRLVAGEGDNLSGLIIDIYDKHAIIQCHTEGMLKDLDMIAAAIDKAFDGSLETMYLKSINIRNKDYDSRFLKGSATETTVLENNHKFAVNWKEGQKTGFFLDQRDNRKLLGALSKNRDVLNTFCYTGGFSVYATSGGANSVTSIDISAPAMELTNKNMQLNGDATKHESITGNVLNYLSELKKDQFDLMVLDPPAFAKNRNKSHNAVQAYKRLNAIAMSKIKSGGLIFSFSCSQVVDRTLFENTIRAAAIESGRTVRLLHHLSQAPDHCVDMYHQEGHYLKGVVVSVTD